MTETKRRARRLFGLLPFSYRGTLLAEAKRIRAKRQGFRKLRAMKLAEIESEKRVLQSRQKRCDEKREELGKLIDCFTNVTVQHPGQDRDRGHAYSMRIDMLPEYAMRRSSMNHQGEFDMLAEEMGHRVHHEVVRIFRTLDFKRLDEYPRLPRYSAFDRSDR